MPTNFIDINDKNPKPKDKISTKNIVFKKEDLMESNWLFTLQEYAIDAEKAFKALKWKWVIVRSNKMIREIEEKENIRKQSGEDFTPKSLVNEILDKLPKDLFIHNKSFIDPACGNGNFLIEVLKRKLDNKHDPLEAIKSIYGTDIMLDNIKECRLRLLKVIANYTKTKRDRKYSLELVKAVSKNIVCTPLDKYPNGSLDYDFEFSHNITDLQAEQGLAKIKNEKLLDQVSI